MGRPSIASSRVEEILTAFECCVMEKGLDKTTLVDIAEKSGLPRSLVRHFIGNRADLEAKLIVRVLERVERKFAILSSPTEGQSLETLRDFVMSEIFSDQALNRLVRELWHVAIRSERVKSALSNMYRQVLMQLSAHVASENNANDDEQINPDVFDIFVLGMGLTVMAEFNIAPLPADHN